MNRTKAQYIRGTNRGQDVPDGRRSPAPAPARPSPAFALILELGERVKGGEMTPGEYGRALEAVKMAERRAIMAGRIATEDDLRGAIADGRA